MNIKIKFLCEWKVFNNIKSICIVSIETWWKLDTTLIEQIKKQKDKLNKLT